VFTPYDRDVESMEKSSDRKRLGPALIATKLELESKGGVVCQTLAKACAQFVEHKAFLARQERARPALAERNAALQVSVKRV
jgi:hypothetical protein